MAINTTATITIIKVRFLSWGGSDMVPFLWSSSGFVLTVVEYWMSASTPVKLFDVKVKTFRLIV